MATFNLTRQVTNPASSSTQNVSSGDTINFTITIPSGTSDTTPEIFASSSNCTLNQASDSSSPFTFTATSFTSSSYSVGFSFVDTDSNTTAYSHTVSGTVGSSLTAPIISSVTNNNASAANVTATVNLSSNGSGGTLQYAQTTANSVPSTGWQTSANFTHPRNATRYYWASQDEDTSGAFDSSGAIFVGYIAPDTDITVGAVSPASPYATSYAGTASVTVTGLNPDEYYALFTTNTNTPQANGHVVDTSGQQADGEHTFVFANNELPEAGLTATYAFRVTRAFVDGGDQVADLTGDTISLTRTGSSTYSINAPASINEGSAGTINVTTTNVSNGTTLYWDLDQDTDYSTDEGTVSISSNAGSFTITPTADSTTEGAETDTIRLYTDSGRTSQVASDSFTINDTSTGSGGSSGGSDGTSTYGIEVTGPDGTTSVFGVNLRQINAIVLDSQTLAQSGSISYTGIANATDATKVAVAVFPGTPGFFQVSGVTVSRSTASGGTITLTNAAPFSLAIKVSIYRIS